MEIVKYMDLRLELIDDSANITISVKDSSEQSTFCIPFSEDLDSHGNTLSKASQFALNILTNNSVEADAKDIRRQLRGIIEFAKIDRGRSGKSSIKVLA